MASTLKHVRAAKWSRRISGALAVLALSMSSGAAQPLQTPFFMSKPAGDGPFPAVVILHDCSGLNPRSSGAPWRWSSQLMQRGYVTVWPDSFGARGRTGGVCMDPSPPRVPPEERVADAYSALSYLRSLPFVDGRRIAVMGGSHGGTSALAAIVDNPANAQHSPGFAAAVALYPNCNRSLGDWAVARDAASGPAARSYAGVFKPLAPLLILIGELDDWTPAAACRKLADAARAAGYPVEIKVYPGAHHSFDGISPVRYVAGRINSNSPTGRGATTGGNRLAWADAIEQVKRFLSEHVMK